MLLLALADGARATIFRRSSTAGYQPFPPNRMPGWDWWRTYPWSPYNYGRNPYNPAWYPYPPTYTYPVYPPYPPPPPGYDPGSPPPAMYPTHQGPTVLLPHPTGAIRVPPANAAVLQIRVPDAYAQVLFDGEKTSSNGTTRYYVTPDLQAGKDYHYTVTATWQRDGQTVKQDRQVKVAPGMTSVVDFTRPAP
jgi:uncharacterized protein (TIGR03000 family)